MAVAGITYADVKQYIQDWSGSTSSTEELRMQLRVIEDGMDDLMNSYSWPWAKSIYQVTTVGGRTFTLGASLDNGDTTATASGTPFTVNELVGKWLVPSGSRGTAFQVKSNTTSVITFVQQYSGVTIESGDTCTVYAPSYALPDYFGTLESVTLLGNGIQPVRFTRDTMEAARTSAHSSGMVRGWYVGSLSSDGLAGYVQPRLWLYPNPIGPAIGNDDEDGTAQVLQITFSRRWGWFDATTNAWKKRPTADTDILDFPETQRGLLRSVIKYALIKEFGRGGNPVTAENDMARRMAFAIGSSEEDGTPFQLASHYGTTGGGGWKDTINWNGSITT